MAMNMSSGRSGGRGRRRGGQRAPMADINVTPLVDVMLVLVVILIVTAPLLASAMNFVTQRDVWETTPVQTLYRAMVLSVENSSSDAPLNHLLT